MPSDRQRIAELEAISEDLQAGLYRTSLGLGAISTKNLKPRSVVASTIDVSNLQSVSQKTGNLDVTGSIKAGQTALDTGTGFFMGSAGTLSVGNSGGNKLVWNGTTLTVTGSLTVTGGTVTGSLAVGTGGSISSGKTSYGDNTNAGYWLEYNGGTPRVDIGSATAIASGGSRLQWDGSTLSIGGTVTAGSGDDVAVMSGADATYRFWAGDATAADAPFRVDKDGNVVGTSFSSMTVAGSLAANQNLGTGDITVNSTGKIKFGTSAADYLANDILHFEVSGSSVAKMEWKYSGWSSGNPFGAVNMAASSTQSDGNISGTGTSSRSASVGFTASNSDGGTVAFMTAVKSGGNIGADYTLSAAGTHTWQTDNLTTGMSLARTNNALSLTGLLYPGTGSASQSTRHISDTGTEFRFGTNSDSYMQLGPDGMTVLVTEATPAGGSTGTRVLLGQALVGIYWGSGVPSVAAANGSIYLRTDGAHDTTLYVRSGGAWNPADL